MNQSIVVLTPEQEAIVGLTDGAYLVVAPPGSGKTEVLAQRIVRLVHAEPEAGFKILALSFTKGAAATMRRRVGERLGEVSWRVVCTTYHAFCTDLLRSYGDLVGLPNDFTLYDGPEDRLQALAQGLVAEGVLDDPAAIDRTSAMEALDAIGRLKRDLVPSSAAPDTPVARLSASLRTAYRAYDLALQLNGAVDFDSVIVKAHELLCAQPDLCAQYRESYRYILIDEAQDTSTVQYELLKVLCGRDHRNVLMVADPAQSIYAFAGASSRFVEAFEREFGAQRHELGATFRCAREILKAAGALLPAQAQRATGGRAQSAKAQGVVLYTEWESEVDEAAAVVDWVESLVRDGLAGGSVAPEENAAVAIEQLAIVARSRNLLRAVVEELERRGTSFHFSAGETGIFDSDEYRSILYGLKVVANGHDMALARSLIACLRNSRFGPHIRDYEGRLDEPGQMLSALAGDLSATTLGPPIAALAAASDGLAISDVLAELAGWDPCSGVTDQNEAEILGGDRDIFRDRWIAYRNRPESVQRGWQGLVLELVNAPRPEASGVRVLTVHAAKGLEFKGVAVVGMNDGSFPDFRSLGPKELESERRLMYVAVTRASRALWLSRARVRQTRFGGRVQQPSRFLAEMSVPQPGRSG